MSHVRYDTRNEAIRYGSSRHPETWRIAVSGLMLSETYPIRDASLATMLVQKHKLYVCFLCLRMLDVHPTSHRHSRKINEYRHWGPQGSSLVYISYYCQHHWLHQCWSHSTPFHSTPPVEVFRSVHLSAEVAFTRIHELGRALRVCFAPTVFWQDCPTYLPQCWMLSLLPTHTLMQRWIICCATN